MAQTFNNMGRKLVKVAVLVLLFSKGVFLTKAAKLKNSSPLLITYEDKITTSAVSRFACFSLCNEGCRFVVYSDRGSDAGVASGFIKVHPNDKVFVGIPDHLDWSSSKENCETLGWRLASAESPSLLDRTKTLMQNNDFWLGAKKEIGGLWCWLSGAPMSPLPLEGDEDRKYNIKCLLVYQGTPDDSNTVVEAMYVCEITF